MEDKHLVRELFILTNKMKRLLDKNHQANDIYLGQARILTYLYRNKDRSIYQKDIEQTFQIRGGTVTGMLETLEKMELIVRVESTKDKRRRKVILTESGTDKAINAIKTNRHFEDLIKKELTDKEEKDFYLVLSKLNNLVDAEEYDEETI